jgi:hypothetical protein
MPVTPEGEIIDPSELAKDQIDCVLCHGKTYNGGGTDNNRQVLTDGEGKAYWSMATLADARTVGDDVTAAACKRCHINTGGKVFTPDGTMSKAYKYGTDFVAESYELTYDTGLGYEETATIDSDVHAAAEMTCAECHYIEKHKFQYGHHNVAWAHDQVPDTFDCTTSGCHTETPHASSSNYYKDTLDSHGSYLACQTCHITHTGGLMSRDLREPVAPDGEGHFYTFNDEVRYGVKPEYRWFNGKSGGWEGVLEGPCPIGPIGSRLGNMLGDGSKITPFKRYEAMVWFDLFVLQPVPYILKDFFVDGDLTSAANKGMESSGWIPEGSSYDFETRKALGIVFGFPMVCALKLDHGVQAGEQALGYATKDDVTGCNSCHSSDSSFWQYLEYNPIELWFQQMPRTAQ